MLNFKQKLQALNNDCELMNGREKGDSLKDGVFHIDGYDYLSGEEGDFIVFTIKEDDKHFYFGNSVLTGKIKEVEEICTVEEIADELKTNGIPTQFEEKLSKNKRKYVKITFYPEV